MFLLLADLKDTEKLSVNLVNSDTNKLFVVVTFLSRLLMLSTIA